MVIDDVVSNATSPFPTKFQVDSTLDSNEDWQRRVHIYLEHDDPYQIHSDLKNKRFTIDKITRHDTLIPIIIVITALVLLLITYTIFLWDRGIEFLPLVLRQAFQRTTTGHQTGTASLELPFRVLATLSGALACPFPSHTPYLTSFLVPQRLF
jgi:hypothetical protein